MKPHTQLIVDIVERGKQIGLSQAALARRGGISPEQLSRLVAGGPSARAETVTKLASVVGLRLALVVDDDYAADLLSGKLIDFSEGGR